MSGFIAAVLGSCGADVPSEASQSAPESTTRIVTSATPEQDVESAVVVEEMTADQLDDVLPTLDFELDGSTSGQPRSASGIRVWTAPASGNLPDSDVCLVFEMSDGSTANLCHVVGVTSGVVSGAVGLDVNSDKRLGYFLVDESVNVSVDAAGSECDLASVPLASSMLWSCVVSGSTPLLRFVSSDDQEFLLRSSS